MVGRLLSNCSFRSSLIWFYTVWTDPSVQKLRIITLLHRHNKASSKNLLLCWLPTDPSFYPLPTPPPRQPPPPPPATSFLFLDIFETKECLFDFGIIKFKTESGTNLSNLEWGSCYMSIMWTEWAECLHCMQEVFGSSAGRTQYFFLPCCIWWLSVGIHSRVTSIKEYVLVPAWFWVSIIKIKHLELLSQVNSSHGSVGRPFALYLNVPWFETPLGSVTLLCAFFKVTTCTNIFFWASEKIGLKSTWHHKTQFLTNFAFFWPIYVEIRKNAHKTYAPVNCNQAPPPPPG